MTVFVPTFIDGFPRYQIWTKPSWSTGQWTQQTYLDPSTYPGRAGFEVKKWRRTALPDIGFAIIHFRYGVMNNRNYGPDGNGSLKVPDLGQNEIRILAQGNDQQWYTVWWGTVEHQTEVMVAAAAQNDYATREYHCLDGLARTKRWPLRTHGYNYLGKTFDKAMGHPGFNTMRDDGVVLGNKDQNGTLYDPWGDVAFYNPQSYYHSPTGGGPSFTEQNVVETSLVQARPQGDVVWTLQGATGLFSGQAVWEVQEGMPVFDLIAKICRRQRARGTVFADWTETPGDITSFRPRLSVFSPFANDIQYTLPGPSGAQVTLPGASTLGTTISVDLEGDGRVGEDGARTFELGDRFEHQVDGLETVGECMEIIVTLSYIDGTLIERFSPVESSSYVSATIDQRLQVRWDNVYQLHGLPYDWEGSVGNGNGSSRTAADVRCNDDGSLALPDKEYTTSPICVVVQRDLPMYCEYKYTTSPPTRWDGATFSPTPPVRRPAILWWNVGNGLNTKDLWINLSQVPNKMALPALSGISFHISEYGIKVFSSADDGMGTRTISDTTQSSLGAEINYNDIAVTVSLKLPHRVRFATFKDSNTDFSNAKRIQRIYHPHHHLWMIHNEAMWDVDGSTAATPFVGYTPIRGVAGGSDSAPAILRDDRAGLAQLHNLAWTWYGQPRRTVRFSRKCCGFLPSGTTVDQNGNFQQTPYEKLGWLISTLNAAGQSWTINTPITTMDYDAETGVTTWLTDWSNMEFDYGA